MSNELTTSRPSFLADLGPAKTLEDVSKVMVPPIIKIVQSNARDERLKDEFTPGSVLIMPEYTVLCDAGDEAAFFEFTPLLMYREWIVCNPLGVDPFIRDRTLDPQNVIAKKANLRGDDEPQDPCPEKPGKMLRYFECMNWLVHIHGQESMVPALLSFRSSEYKTGRTLANLAVSRGTEIFAGRYEARVEKHSNSEGEWYGFSIRNAADPWVDEPTYRLFEAANADLMARLDDGNLRTDYEGESGTKGEKVSDEGGGTPDGFGVSDGSEEAGSEL